MKIARMPDGSPEIFHTLQGEGRSTGRPSVFIRASLCNLSCHWCDTPYTWNWEDTNFNPVSSEKFRREEQILDLTIEEIAEAASAFGCHRYVFTGGEPLLQERPWTELMTLLRETEPLSEFEIETNGTLFPKEEFLSEVGQINVSPKLSNSQVEREKRYLPNTLAALAQTGKADFKFVVKTEEDLVEILDLIQDCAVPPSRIFLMPAAATLEELEAHQGKIATMAQDNGFNYSDRLHLRLFGAKRGV